MRIINLTFPKAWSEINISHLEIIAAASGKKLSRQELLFFLFRKFVGIRIMFGKLWYKHHAINISSEIVMEACTQLSYIVDSMQPLNISPLKNIDRSLVGVSFGDYYRAEALISRYNDTSDKKFLIAAIEKLSHKKIRRLSYKKAMAITIWWSGIRVYLQELYPYVLKEGSAAEAANPYFVLQNILATINKGNPQDNDKILEAEVHSVLTSLNNTIEHATRS